MKDYADTGTVVGRMWVQDAETAMKQEQEDMRAAEKVELTTRTSERTFEQMWNAIGESLCNLASSDDTEDAEDKDDDKDDTELGKLSEDDEPGWVMDTISQTV